MRDYEFLVNDDEGTVRVYERYPDNDAVMNHMRVVKDLLGPLGGLIKVTNMEIFGNADEKVKKALRTKKMTKLCLNLRRA